MLGELLGLQALEVATLALILIALSFAIGFGLSLGRWLAGKLK